MKEGLSTWAGYLHHYVIERVAQSELILNQQKRVLNDFYAMLLHTGSCNEGFEMAICPWGNRDYELRIAGVKILGNYPPHGWFASCFNLLLRNMLLREEDHDLHLISTLSPEWIKPNSILKVERAPTIFGLVSFTCKSMETGISLQFKANWHDHSPEKQGFCRYRHIQIPGDCAAGGQDGHSGVCKNCHRDCSRSDAPRLSPIRRPEPG